MTCGAAIAGVIERVDVVMGGPLVGSTTLSGLSFDVVYDPSKLQFVSVSSATSQIFPATALLVGGLADGQQGRAVVSIHQVGGDPDVTVSTGQHVALSLSFRLSASATFGPTPVEFDPSHSEAADASTTITFGSGLAVAHQ